MKEFDLEKCIAGKPVVTRDGSTYKFGAYNPDAKVPVKIVGWINDVVAMHCENGKYFSSDTQTDYDLFMDTETVEGWVNVYKRESGHFETGQVIFPDENTAISSHMPTNYIATVRIQFII